VTRDVKRWSDQSEADLQDALSDIDEFTDIVTTFIATLADTIVPAVKKTFPNQIPWVDGSIRDALNSCNAAYNSGLVSGLMDEYKAAKKRYRA